MGVRLLLVCCIASLSTMAAAAGERSSVGIRVEPFSLKDTSGKPWSWKDAADKKAVVVLFLGTQCPINNTYTPRLSELHKTYSERGVQFLAVNSNHQDTPAAVAEHARKHGIPFPVLRDENHLAADRFGAKRTPEAFVLDSQQVIRYQGRIDDQFGIGFQRPKATREDLAQAIDEVLAGKAVSQPTTPVAGCIIGRAAKPQAKTTITFAKEIAPILQNNCQECHRKGQIGPMELLTHADTAPWAETIREVIQDGRMPPWHADLRFGKFRNDRSLSKKDKDTLLAWIADGCPEGDAKDLPPGRQYAEGWTIGKPDVVFTMPKEFTVPAKAPKNGVRYQNFMVPTNFNDDVWVQAAEAQPGNRAVVHHIIVYVFKDGKRLRDPLDGIGNGFLTAYAPGDIGVILPPGAAKKVPKGAVLVFQMHYTPNGTEQSDRSSVGLVFAKEPPKYEVRTRAIAQQLFLIPPRSDNFKVTSRTTFSKDTLLWSYLPHMHLRGKSFEYKVTYPDGQTTTLLSVPRYDFNWQASYRLEEPLRLPAGTRIECTAHFDNSAGNPSNPDPTRWIYWGEQTWEEMMIGFVDYTVLIE